MDKSINYLSKDFESIKSELISFSEKYYPEISNNFNDSSVGSWLIDLLSAVGDDLAYHIDRCYQETNINSAYSYASLMNTARINGIKVPGPKSSICEIELSCEIPMSGTTNTDTSQMNWKYVPLIKMGSVVGNGTYRFELTEDVNFNEQFNSNGVSNRKFEPKRNSNGIITAYTVTKSTVVTAGVSKVYKKVLSSDDIEPFMEIILPDLNVMNVESIIFKESASYNSEPQTFEYYIDDEEYMLSTESVKTYRYFEVNSLSDQYRFGTKTKYEGEGIDAFVADEYSPNEYVDYTESSAIYTDGANASTRTSRFFKGEWKPITQKFITEYTDGGYMKITFGGSNAPIEIPSEATEYGKYMMSKIVNNDMLGILPKAGWTMYILYRTGGGASSNLAPNSINNIINMNMIFPNCITKTSDDTKVKAAITKSMSVNNKVASIAGKDRPSIEELRNYIKYNIGSQDRCVTVKDYKSRVLSILPKYGCPFRCNAIEANNKIVIPMLNLNPSGKLTSFMPQTLVDNLTNYLSHYKTIGDYIEMKSGRIYNIGFLVDIFVDKNYTTSDVISNVIDMIYDYMNINRHEMGEDIFIGDLEKNINLVDGVIGLINLNIYAIYNGSYSSDVCPLPRAVAYGENCKAYEDIVKFGDDGSEQFKIDLEAVDNVLYNDYNAMYEVYNKDQDIKIRVKLR